MTAGEHLQAAMALLGDPGTADGPDPFRPAEQDVALAQVHLLAAIAIELGVPVVPGTHGEQATP